VLIFENVMLYNRTGQIDANAGAVDITKAAMRREGTDVSLITYGGSLQRRWRPPKPLAAEGISAEVIDLRTLRPLDDATIMASVGKTRRAVIVDEGWRSGSLSAEISARIMEQALWSLDGPWGRVCAGRCRSPIPSIWRTPRSRRCRASSRPPRRRWGAEMGVFTMPSLGADMEAGKLVEWMVKPGDTVKRGDMVAVVETQKGAIEIEIFEEGTVSELTAELGTELPVGAPLAVVLKPGEAPPAPEAAPAPAPTAAPKPAPVPEPNPAMVATLPAPAPPAAPPGSRPGIWAHGLARRAGARP
jgi:predicted RecA/RadA family phage recombinase